MSVVQSVLFDRNLWSRTRATNWLSKNDFKYSKVDYKPLHLRFRQHSPKFFTRFRTENIGHGIILIIGFH